MVEDPSEHAVSNPAEMLFLDWRKFYFRSGGSFISVSAATLFPI